MCFEEAVLVCIEIIMLMMFSRKGLYHTCILQLNLALQAISFSNQRGSKSYLVNTKQRKVNFSFS